MNKSAKSSNFKTFVHDSSYIVSDIDKNAFCYPFLLVVFANLSCSFEEGFCGWKNLRGSRVDQFDWTLWNGSTPSRNTGPAKDHTLGTSKGDSLVNNTRDRASKISFSD